MMGRPLRVAVLMGGIGPERQVSLESGAAAADALTRTGYHVQAVDIHPDRLEVLDEEDIDVFFVALHGVFGEDGQLQRLMDKKALIYTGSGPEACEAAFDKLATKRVLAAAGIDVPPYLSFDPKADKAEMRAELARLGQRLVVKPTRQGSSVGISMADDPDQAIEACARTFSEFGDCLVEQYVQGREVSVGILLGEPLPVIEIRPKRPFYDYLAKYEDDQTEFLFGSLPGPLDDLVREQARAVFEALGMRQIGRIDMIVSPAGQVMVLEANAIPGLTGHSLLPKAAGRAGIEFGRVCAMIVTDAFQGRCGRARRCGRGY